MFDANARYLDKGTMFFASNEDDLYYCEMLEEDHMDPSIKIIASFKGTEPFLYKCVEDWSLVVFEGYYEDGKLLSFVFDEQLTKAKTILLRGALDV